MYRPEIDGMRALAVIAVIVAHFDFELLPNGHLGVDIFFVISGFVITQSLLSRQHESFLQFNDEPAFAEVELIAQRYIEEYATGKLDVAVVTNLAVNASADKGKQATLAV